MNKSFEDAGWISDPHIKQRFKLPTIADHYKTDQYGIWSIKDYKAVISVRLRSGYNYSSYVPEAQQKNIKRIPAGYLVFIEVYKKSQYSDSYKNEKQKEEKNETK